MSQKYIRLLLLVVFLVAMSIYIAIPNGPGIHFGGIDKNFETRLGLDLVGGVQALLEADLPEGASIDQDAMSAAKQIVENRVNGLGVNEAVVQQAGTSRILVELPGETDPEKALTTLQKTGLLEFVDFSTLTPEEQSIIRNIETPLNTDYGLSQDEISRIQNAELAAQSAITETATVTSTISSLSSRVFHTIMTGANLKTVGVQTNELNQYVIAFELDSSGAEIFKEFTTGHIGQVLAIVLDKRIISSPVINDVIPDGRGIISGDFTYETANDLAIQLRYGSLPIPLKVVETRTVGPTLGQDSLNKSLIAGIIGFSIVVLFMGLYYRLPGLTADIALVIYALLTFALYRFIPITLTLPGVAGFLLSTGSALDANILIFERIKEELRSGRPLHQAIDLGWKRARPSILDSNIATIITGLILFWFGSTFGATIVKGFSVTLLLGVLISLFTAFVITRLIMQIVMQFYKSSDYAKWFGI